MTPIWTKQERLSPGPTATSLSNNQSYPEACVQAANDCRAFNNFRRNPAYNQILEHVTQQQGAEYLRLLSRNPEILAAMDRFRRNDDYGNPITFEYPGCGTVSPTTLRYVKVLAEMQSLFGTLDSFDICEIGVGYGGQCRVINEYFDPRTYCLVDIRPALALAQRFLDNYILHSVVTYKTANELHQREYDLVVSNYAFTELPRPLQDVYLRKAILDSKRGYITYNEITPAEFRSYKADELVAMIPGARILPEQPLTHHKNCVIVWGDSAAAR